ncbi:unnamed protein product [Ectocarpus fasciculatus]
MKLPPPRPPPRAPCPSGGVKRPEMMTVRQQGQLLLMLVLVLVLLTPPDLHSTESKKIAAAVAVAGATDPFRKTPSSGPRTSPCRYAWRSRPSVWRKLWGRGRGQMRTWREWGGLQATRRKRWPD